MEMRLLLDKELFMKVCSSKICIVILQRVLFMSFATIKLGLLLPQLKPEPVLIGKFIKFYKNQQNL